MKSTLLEFLEILGSGIFLIALTMLSLLILDAAKETGTAMEINSQPQRMDLNDHMARRAKEKGVWLVINTDAHQSANLEFMEEGISIARREE